MKFKTYLNEVNEKEINEVVSLIEKNCKEYLKYFYKNKTALISGRKYENSDFIDKEIRKNREPLDSPLFLHEFLDSIFNKKFGKKLRSESMFCKSDGDVRHYGNKYIIFPIGKYNLYYSNTIRDLYSHISDLIYNEYGSSEILKDLKIYNNIWFTKGNKYGSEKIYMFNGFSREKVKKWLTDINIIDKYDIESIDDLKEITKNDVIDTLKTENIQNSYEKSKDWKNIEKDHEVMLYCDKVFMIKEQSYLWSRVKDILLNK